MSGAQSGEHCELKCVVYTGVVCAHCPEVAVS